MQIIEVQISETIILERHLDTPQKIEEFLRLAAGYRGEYHEDSEEEERKVTA